MVFPWRHGLGRGGVLALLEQAVHVLVVGIPWFEGWEVWFQASCPHEVEAGEEGAVHVEDVPDCESPRSLDR